MNYEEKKDWLEEQKASLAMEPVDIFQAAYQARRVNLQLIAELEKAWKALEFYAEEDGWKLQLLTMPPKSWIVHNDAGDRARKALNV